ncbi:winged helix-turn-helix transcriptional regulator [Streptomyces sp. NPDC018045]|uniref:winged helix-turn-helix transcriptional regulator n=1 Tax=Streptomyces sp. NPDC018045 TaxID=3365037 RepID=UPI0037A2E7E1
MIERTYHPDIPPRVEYALSDLGRTLTPVFQTLTAWGEEHLAGVEAARRHTVGRRRRACESASESSQNSAGIPGVGMR